jgi:hypothetical protein
MALEGKVTTMGLEDRKAALRKEIERKERYLESLEAMPDFDGLADGSIVALTVTYGASRPYPVVAYKGGEGWFLTGAKSPNGITGDELSEWLMSQGRHLRSATVVAEFTLEPVAPAFDLGEAMLSAMREFPGRRVGFYAGTYDEASGRGL